MAKARKVHVKIEEDGQIRIARVDKDNTEKIERESEKPGVNRSESVISWQAPEYEQIHKDISWYWLSLIVAIVIAVAAIWQNNFLFAIFIGIAWLVFVNLARRLPPTWIFKISKQGLAIHSASESDKTYRLYLWQDIDGFDIHEATNEFKWLVLRIKSRFSPYLKINFYHQDEEKIKNFLLEFLPKEEYKKSVADSISEIIGF